MLPKSVPTICIHPAGYSPPDSGWREELATARVVESTSMFRGLPGSGHGADVEASSDAFAREKLDTIRASGAQLEILPSEGGHITPGVPDNRSGYQGVADERLRDTDGRIDAFIMAVGTGGCFSANAQILEERCVAVRCVAVEPASAPLLSGGLVTGHHIASALSRRVPARR